ncbi:MAG: SDR family oxidoreductase [Ignavibacteria bacterium]|nr:SDR family oxidoreductase [Ignavibacteria bacterium]
MQNKKSVIVTGGTGGLGRRVVEKLTKEGLKVYIPSRSIDEFNGIFDSSKNPDSEFSLRKIYSFECDAENENEVNEFIDKVLLSEKGEISGLVNLVGGINEPSKIENLNTSDLMKMFSLNFLTCFYFTKGVMKIMKKNNFGRIISIGAIAALEPTPERLAYSISKNSVINLMNTVSLEMKGYNIKCNTIIPSIIDTPANREWGSEDEIKKWVKPEEISDVIYGLISGKLLSVRESVIKIYGEY